MPDLPILLSVLPIAVYAVMLVALGLIVFVPFFPGVMVIAGGLAIYVGIASYLAHEFAGVSIVGGCFSLLFALMGIFSSQLTEKFGIRYTHVSQQVMWGAIIGSLVIGMALPGLFWFMVGMLLGAIAMQLTEGQRFLLAVRDGLAAVYTMLGPRGFQLVMAMLIVSAATPVTPLLVGRLQLLAPATRPSSPDAVPAAQPSDAGTGIVPPEEMPPDEPQASQGSHPSPAGGATP